MNYGEKLHLLLCNKIIMFTMNRKLTENMVIQIWKRNVQTLKQPTSILEWKQLQLIRTNWQ